MSDNIFDGILTEELPDDEEIIIPEMPKPKKKKEPEPKKETKPRTSRTLPMKYKDRIIKEKAIRRFLKEKNIKKDLRPSFLEELNKEVKFIILKAKQRSDKAKRKSLRGRDV